MEIQESTITIQARFCGGKLEPLEPLDLEEGREVTVTVTAVGPAATGGDPRAAPTRGWAGNVPTTSKRASLRIGVWRLLVRRRPGDPSQCLEPPGC
jgi:hypothetical protein